MGVSAKTTHPILLYHIISYQRYLEARELTRHCGCEERHVLDEIPNDVEFHHVLHIGRGVHVIVNIIQQTHTVNKSHQARIYIG